MTFPFLPMLAVLVLTMAAGLSVACGQDMPPPQPTFSPTAIPSPEATTAIAASAVSPVPPTGQPAPTLMAIVPAPRATTADTPSAVAPARSDSESASLRLISSRSVTAPSSILIGRSVGSHDSILPQNVPTQGGLTVSAIGSVTVAADEAYLVVVPEQRFSSSGPEQMTDEDRHQIRENLAQIGVPEEAVEFENLAIYGPSSISVEVELDELVEKRETILDAVEQVIRRYESHGIIYSLSEENCEGALSLARREAIPRAEMAADDLAQALGVSRGMVIGALEYPLNTSVYRAADISDHACGAQSLSPYANLASFDAEPEVEVNVGLQITYGIR